MIDPAPVRRIPVPPIPEPYAVKRARPKKAEPRRYQLVTRGLVDHAARRGESR